MKLHTRLVACTALFSTMALQARQAQTAKIPELAKQALATYQDPDRDTDLGNRIHLQLAAGDDEAALASIHTLRQLRMGIHPARAPFAFLPYELFAEARLKEKSGGSFDTAFKEELAKRLGAMDDRAAFQASVPFIMDLGELRQDLQNTPPDPKTPAAIVDLVRKSEALEVYQRVLPLATPLLAVDDQRRYLIQEDILVPVDGGASVPVVVVRPRAATKPLPAALEFTIYANDYNFVEAKRSAANGFVGVTANTRGKRGASGETVPYEHDGADADKVINWIAKQPWSDGKVGMFGGSYDGFTQWAAAKRPPRALKSIMPSVAAAPGIDVPMEGGVFENFTYSWVPYVTNTKLLDDAGYNDFKRWNGLNWAWFNSDRPYRDLPLIDGHPNPIFERWVDHPSYDAYWQAMIPFKTDFARIRIPVLATTGYYDGGQLSSLYYFQQLGLYNPKAKRYIVIGPYDHIGAQRRSQEELLGYHIDPAARLDVEELRYQWLDYSLRGGPKPALLKDRVNYEVMGANEWKHAPSVEAMGPDSLKLYLDPANGAPSLSEAAPTKPSVMKLKVDMADRQTLSFPHMPMRILDKTLDSDNGFAFRSAPFTEPIEVSGLFSGELRFITNKKDLDLDVQIYEQTPAGQYFFLAYLAGRVSYLKDRSHRQLLHPGQLEVLPFRSGRMTSRRLESGSRLVLVVKVDKSPTTQVNYGTGKDVSRESSKDAGPPLELDLQAGSFLRLPISK